MAKNASLFLSDGKRTIDFVLVYKANMSNENKGKLEYYLQSLSRIGLAFEIEPFTESRTLVFVKVHAPRDIVVRYSDICDIELAFMSKEYRPTSTAPHRFRATPLTLPNPEDPVYRRAPESVSGQLPEDVTSAEKIMVLSNILNRTKYGPRYADFGLMKLIYAGVFYDAFPLHDGPYQWTDSGPLSDRQLLAKFWGSPRCWYKAQPLNLIEKYFGTEVAFYFAWCGFYMQMLIPASILSIMCLVYGVLTMETLENVESDEICGSKKVMCPRCHYAHCKYEKLSNSCMRSYLAYLHDNPATMAFAIIISFWSTIFMEFWERQEAVLQLQWNVKALEHDTLTRPEYISGASGRRYSPITRELEPYMTKKATILRYTITLASVILMLMIMVLATFGVMIYRITVSLIMMRETDEEILEKNVHLMASMSGSFMSASFIFLFRLVYTLIAMWLTDMENHRTQSQYDNSYIYKCFALAFTNNYAAVFYIAFLKGRFFTHPGDMSLWSTFGGLGSDICDPTGCIADLAFQMMSIMLMKIFVNNVVQMFIPLMMEIYKRVLHRIRHRNTPLCGKEFLMCESNRFFLIDEYMDLVIQYGFIVFFIAGFPLAPLLALINNFIEMRVDAFKFTRYFRRPVPRKVRGLGAWLAILRAMTYIGVTTNAVVIAFTSDFVSKELYRRQVSDDLSGFTNNSLSAFATKDFKMVRGSKSEPAICYYPGRRYPPDDERKYQPTKDFWFVLAMRFLTVVVFEHIIISLQGILAYSIHDVPAHVSKELAIQERKKREARMNSLARQLKGTSFGTSS